LHDELTTETLDAWLARDVTLLELAPHGRRAGARGSLPGEIRARTVNAPCDPADVFAGNHHVTPA
jgi:hypothetical protein